MGTADAGVEIHVAVVHAAGEICHVTAATSAPALTVRLAEYVRGHLDYQLWPADADRVRELLSRDRFADAVSLFFERASKWDPVRLERRSLELGVADTAGRDGRAWHHRPVG